MFEPMLATKAEVPLESLVGTHVFDTKLDGVRMLAYWDGEHLTLRTRHGGDRTSSWPELVDTAHVLGTTPLVLDGEVIIPGGAFQDVNQRNLVTRSPIARRLAVQKPACFVAFDILRHGEEDVRHWTFEHRRALLAATVGATEHWDITLCSGDPSIYDLIREGGGEGVIAKRWTSRYTPGKSSNWLKFKALNTLTCIGVGYEPGTGSRAAFGAMLLALIDGDKPVVVGKVGTGFTDLDIRTMKAIFDNARSGDDLPVVEVECLGLTRDGVLRQPSYKGVRSDLTMHDALFAQLEGLPRS